MLVIMITGHTIEEEEGDQTPPFGSQVDLLQA